MIDDWARLREAFAELGRAMLAPGFVLPLAAVWLAIAIGAAVWYVWRPLAGWLL